MTTSPFFRTMALSAALLAAPLALVPVMAPQSAAAATAQDLNTDANQALKNLYANNKTAKLIGSKARAILVFPNIIKAGLVFGGAYGEGILQSQGKLDSYYNSFSGSWGLQAGAQSYGYVVFLMNEKATQYLADSQGWEIGVGPTVVVVDEGVARNLTSTTLQDDAYAFIFNQKGLMAGVSIEGTKISRIKKQ
jgi:lipid-binding SYLF domain-containing protein